MNFKKNKVHRKTFTETIYCPVGDSENAGTECLQNAVIMLQYFTEQVWQNKTAGFISYTSGCDMLFLESWVYLTKNAPMNGIFI